MGYQKPSVTQMKRVAKTYGEDSAEYRVLKLIEKGRVAPEAIEEILQFGLDAIKEDLSGGLGLSENQHLTMINFLKTIIPMGLERGLLPCRDLALSASVLRTLVEIYQLQTQIRNLQ